MARPNKKRSDKQVPSGSQPLAGSEHPPHPKTKILGAARAREAVKVMLIVRRRPDGPPLKDLEYFTKVPIPFRTKLSRQQFEDAHGAMQADLDEVGKFCLSHGLEVVQSHRSRRSMVASGTVAQMNSAFGVKLHHYESPLGKYRGFAGSVLLPASLHGIVEAIIGLDNRPVPSRHLLTDPPNTGIPPLTPTKVAQLYHFPAETGSGQTIGIYAGQLTVTNSSGQEVNYNAGYTLPDLAATVSAWGVSTAPVPIDFPAGSNYGPITGPTGETTLDISVASAIAPAATIVVYFNTGSTALDIVDTLQNMIHPMQASDPHPTIVNICYAWSADDDTSFISAMQYTQMDQLFQDAANLRITVLTGSGDWGASFPSAAAGPTQAEVVYPASDPWLLTCGGTTVGDVSGSSFDEYVWNDIYVYQGTPQPGATGGGVSALFPVPPYQTSLTTLPLRNTTGTAGRGVPDVAGNASVNTGVNITLGGSSGSIGGTSMVAPLYAGLVARLNQHLGESVGFLNPTIYQLGLSVCRDVTGMAGPVNNTFTPSGGQTVVGYPANVGWDACTGWGSIDGTALLNALTALFQQTMYFVVDKSTFGVDEVLDTSTYSQAFWVTVEGYSKNQLISASGTFIWPQLSGAFFTFPGVTISPDSSGPLFELPDSPFYADTPQRVMFPFDITFSVPQSTNAFPTAPPSLQELLTATLGIQNPPQPAETVFELVSGADPYFTNVDPTQNNVFYLSQDLRVFTATPAPTSTPISGTVSPQMPPPFTVGNATQLDTDAAYTYIQELIAYLNSNYSVPTPTGTDPFTTIFPDQTGALTGDSSVTQFSANPRNPHIPPLPPYNNYNFAVARVRLRAAPAPASGPATPTVANNVRVFFRLFTTQSNDTDYQPDTTYAYNADAANLPGSPQPGTSDETLPFLASGYYSTANLLLDYPTSPQTGFNDQNISVPPGESIWAYFGCFLNVYDPNYYLNGQQVQSLLNGTHHCLVAQIAYDGAPILNSDGVTMSPENSDKLAQRNLQVTPVDNPGPPATHRAPQTFDLRPSAPLAQTAGNLLNYPDELMIEWGNIPAGTTASIYWPQADALQVLALAKKLHGTVALSASDAHTIQCKVTAGAIYIPIPPKLGTNFAGLFTVDLPRGIVRGQEFNVIVRRIASRRMPVLNVKGNAWATDAKIMTNWRYIVGTFLVKIPVMTTGALLEPEENTLAIMKWRLEKMSPANRWYPVLERYISYISAMVDCLGGHSKSIGPSLGGVTGVIGSGRCEYVEHEGKVAGLVFDHFGDFEGFLLDTREGERQFFSREKAMEELVERAWRERLRICVKSERDEEQRPHSIIVREPPAPF
jgi:hypothetical protein